MNSGICCCKITCTQQIIRAKTVEGWRTSVRSENGWTRFLTDRKALLHDNPGEESAVKSVVWLLSSTSKKRIRYLTWFRTLAVLATQWHSIEPVYCDSSV
ncbi:hypothetical protein L208DRAFT_1408721 [Tricholoma matsutake]|nr:hypothetical protein L208DRAFT_1408721 [Tricholoma matsutake 945]